MKDFILYFSERFAWIVFVLFIVSFGTFWSMTSLPGDPVLLRNPKASEAMLQQIRENTGLNDPVIVQYGRHMWGLMQGKMGTSIRYPDTPIEEEMIPAMWVSFQLAMVAEAIGLPLGILLGVFAAALRHTKWDNTIIGALLLPHSMTSIIFLIFLVVIFTLWLGWLPSGGWDGVFSKKIIIPMLALIIPGLAGGARFVRANALSVLESDFVRTARAKGLSPFMVYMRHVLPNAAVPIAVSFVFGLGWVLTGSIFIEKIYGIPGSGKYVFEALFARDYPVVMNYIIIVGSMILVARMLTDVVAGYLDPRVRVGQEQRF